MTSFDFEVLEYDPRMGAAAQCVGASSFSLSERRLIVSTVRSMLAGSGTWSVRHYLAASVIPTLHFFVDRARAPDFCVAGVNVFQLRDFSLTSRIGELAQGISYAYWAFHHRAFVTDFVDWSKSVHPYVPRPTRPDYVVSPLGASYLMAVEAKGTVSHSPKDQMRKALRQAKGTSHHPALSNAFGTVVTFEAHFSLPARIHIQDPESRGQATIRDRWEVFRRSYASFYEMAGDFDKAAQCRGDQGAPIDTRSDFVRRALLAALSLEHATFTVNPMVERAVFEFSAFEEGSWQEALRDWNQERLTDTRLDFPDGTAIR